MARTGHLIAGSLLFSPSRRVVGTGPGWSPSDWARRRLRITTHRWAGRCPRSLSAWCRLAALGAVLDRLGPACDRVQPAAYAVRPYWRGVRRVLGFLLLGPLRGGLRGVVLGDVPVLSLELSADQVGAGRAPWPCPAVSRRTLRCSGSARPLGTLTGGRRCCLCAVGLCRSRCWLGTWSRPTGCQAAPARPSRSGTAAPRRSCARRPRFLRSDPRSGRASEGAVSWGGAGSSRCCCRVVHRFSWGYWGLRRPVAGAAAEPGMTVSSALWFVPRSASWCRCPGTCWPPGCPPLPATGVPGFRAASRWLACCSRWPAGRAKLYAGTCCWRFFSTRRLGHLEPCSGKCCDHLRGAGTLGALGRSAGQHPLRPGVGANDDHGVPSSITIGSISAFLVVALLAVLPLPEDGRPVLAAQRLIRPHLGLSHRTGST